MTILFDLDSLVYSAVSHIVDTDDIREWFHEGRSKEWMKEELTILVINKLDQMANNIFQAIEDTGIMIEGIEYFITRDTESIRREIYPEYKANRRKVRIPERNEDGVIEDVKEWTKVLNEWKSKNHKRTVNRVRRRLFDMDFAACHPRWEADDLIADRAREIGDPNFIILSMDKDFKQIPGLMFDIYRICVFHDYCEFPRQEVVDTSIYKGHNRFLVENAKLVVDQYGQPEMDYRGLIFTDHQEAEQFKYHQIIMGDSGDNIKGVPGVGKVKAFKMIQEAIDNDFQTTAWLAYLEHYGEDEALYYYDLNCFLCGIGTGRSIEHLKKLEPC